MSKLWTSFREEDFFQGPDMGSDLDSRGYAMSTLAVVDSDGFAFVQEVWALHLKNKSPYVIARTLSCKVVDAKRAIETMQSILQDDAESRDVAKDYLHDMIERYTMLMDEAQQNLDDLKALSFDEKVSSQINATLKNIADFDKTRVDLLQKAGLYDTGGLGDELAEREEREQQILQILRNDLCPACAAVVRDKLTKLTGVVEGEVVAEQIV